MNAKLTVEEALDLSRLEKIVERGKQGFIEVGNALLDIRDRRLYRKNHGSFNEYCEQRWGWNASRASQLITAAAVAQGLPSEVITMVTTERVAREVAKLPEGKRAEVLTEASKSTNGHVTAKAINAAADAIKPTVLLKDAIGREIPALVQKYWERLPEVKELCIQLQNVKHHIVRAQKENDLMYAELSATAVADLDNALHALKSTMPYTVCPTCQGHPEVQPKGECRLCCGRGLVSKFRWKAVPEEVRAMIEKGVKNGNR